MLFRSKIYLLAAAIGLASLAGCGSSTNQASAPPSGSFSNSNLNGTYVFSFSGEDVTDQFLSQFAITGTMVANGSGSLTGGTIDLVDPALGSALNTSYTQTQLPVLGNYSITADGRGTGTISVTINGTQVQFGLDFVLSSNSHGMISRFDGNGSGSGTIDLQTSVAQSALQGSYSFGLAGTDSTGTNTLGTVGSFTLDANGNVTSGLQDISDNGNSIGLRALQLQGTVLVGSPGAAQLKTNTAGFGTLHFDVFPIDPTHLKLIETDSVAYISGDAFVSTGETSFPSGPLALIMAGEDTQQYPFAAGGLLTSDGSSQITGGLEDVNDDGYVQGTQNVSGSFRTNGVRTQLTLTGLFNGNFYNFSPGTGTYAFAAYPYSGGVMLLETDNGGGTSTGISGGNLYAQTSTSLNTSSAGYALNLSGVNSNGQTDWISEFTANGNSRNGLYDANNFGLIASDLSLNTGSSSVASNGRGTISFPTLQTNGNSWISALDLTVYTLNSSTAVFLETDGNQISTGELQMQTGTDGTEPAATSAARSHVSFMKPAGRANAKPQLRISTR
jgi:hypothetical protein